MARAKGFLTLSGSLGETTFRKIGKKTYAQEKLNISDGSLQKGSQFQSLRKNGKRMGNASKSSGVIRHALNTITTYTQDLKMAGRFNAELMKVVKLDKSRAAAVYGKLARAENMEHLLGFDFNAKVSLRATFNVAYTLDVNRDTGEVKINISSFKPAWAVKAPPLATRFSIIAQVAAIDFDPDVDFNVKYKGIEMYSSDKILLDETPTDPLTITFTVKPGNVDTIFITLGVSFLDLSNPVYSSLAQSSRVSAGCIVGIDPGVTLLYTGPVPYDEVKV